MENIKVSAMETETKTVQINSMLWLHGKMDQKNESEISALCLS